MLLYGIQQCFLLFKVQDFFFRILDGPDYIPSKFEGSFIYHFNSHCMRIKLREMLLQKMFGGKRF